MDSLSPRVLSGSEGQKLKRMVDYFQHNTQRYSGWCSPCTLYVAGSGWLCTAWRASQKTSRFSSTWGSSGTRVWGNVQTLIQDISHRFEIIGYIEEWAHWIVEQVYGNKQHKSLGNTHTHTCKHVHTHTPISWYLEWPYGLQTLYFYFMNQQKEFEIVDIFSRIRQ